MGERPHSTPKPGERPRVPATASERHMAMTAGRGWSGPTYYGRSQLKPAPFNNWVVGGYIFLAGLSGSATLLGALAEEAGGPEGRRIAARARYVGTLAPTIGSVLLIWDLHTPKRFYNMLRIAKARSPMSIGTWILMGYTAFALPSAGAQIAGDLAPGMAWTRPVARFAQVPAAIAGMGLSVYTAALLAATSTPTWAAAPRAMAVRFGASSVAAGSAALAIGGGPARGPLRAITVAALLVETAAAWAQDREIARMGVHEAKRTGWGRTEALTALGIGTALPIGLMALARLLKRPARRALMEDAAAAAVLAGSAMLRISVMEVGAISARRSEISFRFTEPANLPRDVTRDAVPATAQRALRYPKG